MRTVKFDVMFGSEIGTKFQLCSCLSNNFDSAISFNMNDYEENIENMGIESEDRKILDDFCKENDVQCFVYEYWESFPYNEKIMNIGRLTVYYN